MVFRIKSNFRNFQAIIDSADSNLFRTLLQPKFQDFYVRSGNEDPFYPPNLLPQKLNSDQRKIMSACASMATSNPNNPQSQIVLGPPGTGKSTTISAMVMQIIFRHRKMFPGTPLPRILITAPSNAAVDELVS